MKPVIIINSTNVSEVRHVRREFPSVAVMTNEQSARIIKENGDAEGNISAACINLLMGLLIEHPSIMKAGAKNKSTKDLIEEQLHVPLFGVKSTVSQDGTKHTRANQPNSWSSTKASVLAFLAKGFNPFIIDETGNTVGYWGLGAMREQLKKKSTRTVASPLADCLEALGECNLDEVAQVLEKAANLQKLLQASKDSAESSGVKRLEVEITKE